MDGSQPSGHEHQAQTQPVTSALLEFPDHWEGLYEECDVSSQCQCPGCRKKCDLVDASVCLGAIPKCGDGEILEHETDEAGDETEGEESKEKPDGDLKGSVHVGWTDAKVEQEDPVLGGGLGRYPAKEEGVKTL